MKKSILAIVLGAIIVCLPLSLMTGCGEHVSSEAKKGGIPADQEDPSYEPPASDVEGGGGGGDDGATK